MTLRALLTITMMLLTLVLGGCTEAPPDSHVSADSSDPVEAGADFVWQTDKLTGSFSLVNAPSAGSGSGSNCARFTTQSVQEIVSGTVTVAWSSDTPAGQELELVVQSDEVRKATGQSPLSLDLEQMPIGDRPLAFFLQPPPSSASGQVEMLMEWEFKHDGKPMTWREYSCSRGS